MLDRRGVIKWGGLGLLGGGLATSPHGLGTIPPAMAAKAAENDRARRRRRQRLHDVSRWGIQLRLMRHEAIAQSPFDLVVIDYAPFRHLSFEFPYLTDEVLAMQRRPDGGRRLVIAYLSIGEAEDYRYYWRREWNEARPAWMGAENRQWPGNFPVRFWHADWRDLIYVKAGGFLERIMAAGFDGVYLDRADVFEEWVGERKSAEADMIDFVVALAKAAHDRNPEFLVILQNAEELLRHARVRAAIDGFAKEDLLFGVGQDEAANAPDVIAATTKLLRLGQRSGCRVLVLEYLKDPAKTALARRRILAEGFLPHFAERSLSTLTTLEPDTRADGDAAAPAAGRPAPQARD